MNGLAIEAQSLSGAVFPMPVNSDGKPTFRVVGDIAYISLNSRAEAIIDALDLMKVCFGGWHMLRTPNTDYAIRKPKINGKRITQYLHRLILDAPDNLFVDHINGNGLDNRRSNLRLATRAQNASNVRKSPQNKSGFKGVSWDPARGAWAAQIRANNKDYRLGFYVCPKEAHAAYCAASKELHGEFGRFE